MSSTPDSHPRRKTEARSFPEHDVDDGVRIGYPVRGRDGGALLLGPGARLRSGTVLYDASRIGAGFETGHGVVIREDCEIGAQVSVWSNTVVDYGVRIGDRVKIHANCYVAQYTRIDDDAFLAPGVTIANDLYPGDAASAKLMTGPHIGAGAQIGVNVTILPYVRIGAGAMIGSGSVVTRDIPAGMVAYGNPAVPRRRVADLPGIEERVAVIIGGAGPESAEGSA
jgi:acetyltransferase-like isoleucine patch superfamily enzyme